MPDFAKEFDPNQPRHPKGHPEGGQWVDEGSAAATVREAERWYDEGGTKVPGVNQVTDYESGALRAYSIWEAANLNTRLREKGVINEADTRLLVAVDRAMSRAELPQDKVVWRGAPDFVLSKFEESVGKTVRDPAYVSTSLSKATAEGAGIPYRIKLPRGASALVLGDGNTHFSEEREVLIARGSTFRVKKDSKGVFLEYVKSPKWLKTRAGEVSKAFDPNQPRHPKGDERGGQWTSAGGSGGALSDEELDALVPRWEGITDRKQRERAQAALEAWTAEEGFELINSELRNGGPLDWATGRSQQDIRGLDRVFDRAGHELVREATVYRVIDGQRFSPGVGTTFVDRGFVATTARGYVANGIASEFSSPLRMQISLPAGARVIAPDGRYGAAEVLLPRGGTYKVTGKQGGIIQVEYVAGVAKYDPDQPRKPKGDPEGGQWTGGEGEGSLQERAQAAVDEVEAKLYRNPLSPRMVGFANKEQTAIVMMELEAHDDAIYLKWLQASPHKMGMGTRGVDYLKEVAARHKVPIKLQPWERGEIGAKRLGKIFRAMGFKEDRQSGDFFWYPSSMEKFDPDQPRHPKGHPEGGQWAGQGGEIIAYHGSTEDIIESVRQHGLIVRANKRNFDAGEYLGERGQSIYLSTDLGEARGWPALSERTVGKKFVVFEVRIPGEHRVSFKDDEFRGGDGTSYRFVGAIPPSWITGYSVQAPGGAWSSFKSFSKARGRTLYLALAVDEEVEKAFDPNQPRHPKGDERGGQWSAEWSVVRTGDTYRVFSKDGDLVGTLIVDAPKDGTISVFNVYVKDEFRRRGVATALYRAAEANYGQLTPSAALSDEGFSFWSKYRPEAVSGDLRTRRKDLIGQKVTSRFGEGKITRLSGTQAIATTIGGRGEWPVPRVELERLVNKFDPDQPRKPKGDPEGGQWTDGDGGSSKSLREELSDLRPELAQAAQTVVDEWEQDEEGMDVELGSGGACDQVCDAMSGVIVSRVPGATVESGGHEGDDHAWLIVHDGKKAYGVDIPAGVYETGGGYKWRKIPGAKINATDVEIWSIPIEHVVEKKYDPNQPRKPKGDPEGGQWVDEGGSSGKRKPRVDASLLDDSDQEGLAEVQRAIDAIPPEHAELIADVPILLQDRVVLNSGREVLGLYNRTDKHIELGLTAEGIRAKDLAATTVHELGHALDARFGNKLSALVGPEVRAAAEAAMPKSSRRWSSHYFSNDREMFAELYSLAYSPTRRGNFGMDRKAADKVFGKMVESLKTLQLPATPAHLPMITMKRDDEVPFNGWRLYRNDEGLQLDQIVDGMVFRGVPKPEHAKMKLGFYEPGAMQLKRPKKSVPRVKSTRR